MVMEVLETSCRLATYYCKFVFTVLSGSGIVPTLMSIIIMHSVHHMADLYVPIVSRGDMVIKRPSMLLASCLLDHNYDEAIDDA